MGQCTTAHETNLPPCPFLLIKFNCNTAISTLWHIVCDHFSHHNRDSEKIANPGQYRHSVPRLTEMWTAHEATRRVLPALKRICSLCRTSHIVQCPFKSKLFKYLFNIYVVGMRRSWFPLNKRYIPLPLVQNKRFLARTEYYVTF